MKTVNLLCAGALLALGGATLAQAQSTGTPAPTNNNQGVLVSGGGPRGALADLPDGWLVNRSEAFEYRGEAGFNEPAALRPRGVMPQIDILKPEPAADLKVKAPFAISVQFKAQPDAAIDPASFKVLYGAFKLDITSRITKFVKVAKEGFSMDNAQIPAGKHRLILQVQDELKRVAERELKVEVE